LVSLIDGQSLGWGSGIAGRMLKVRRTDPEAHPRWDFPNIGATNSSGFTALPGGAISDEGFRYLGQLAAFYTANVGGMNEGLFGYLSTITDSSFYSETPMNSGLSIRCIKDNENGLPLVSTFFPEEITKASARLGAQTMYNGNEEPLEYGIVLGFSPDPVNNGGTYYPLGIGISYNSQVFTDLIQNTTYYVIAYATNIIGTSYGKEMMFSTLNFLSGEGVTDIDDNFYPSVIIGEQEWIAENLRTSRYNNGDPIPTSLSDFDWENTPDGAFAIYPYNVVDGINSDIEMVNSYGVLYNWYAVDDGRGLCPTGWRVPSDADWAELTNYINSVDDVDIGDQLKSCRQVGSPLGENCETTIHPRWNYHDIHYGKDVYGFSALPAGYRNEYGVYISIGEVGTWWSSSAQDQFFALYRDIDYNLGSVNIYENDKRYGFSVRCIKSPGSLPTIETRTDIYSLSMTSAALGGQLLNDGAQTIMQMGIVWSTLENPTVDVNEGIDFAPPVMGYFTAKANGLNPETPYYARAFATNETGTSYGEPITFTTLSESEGLVYDINGNGYQTVQIGSRMWLRDNLKTNIYRDGSPIPTDLDNTAWNN